MFAHRIQGLHMLHAGAQAALMLSLYWFWIAVVFWLARYDTFLAAEDYAMFSLPLLVGLALDGTRLVRQPLNLLDFNLGKIMRLSLQQTLIIVGSLLFFLVATKNQVISRVFLFSFVPLLYVTLLVTNRFLPRILATLLFQGPHVQKTLLLGPSRKARRMASWLKRKTRYGIRAIGLVSDEVSPEPVEDVPWLGSVEDVENVIQATNASQLILLEMSASSELLARLADVCERLGVRFIALQDYDDRLSHPITLIEDDGLFFISLHREPLESPLNRLLKRTFDIAVALPVVLFVLPVFSFVVWCLHRWQSPGPLFCRQERHGLQNQVFRIWKFRTMHLGDHEVARQATAGDSRIFPAGRRLRRHSLDEVPQFINVLRGDMSLVGPRPHLVEHTEEFGRVRRYHVRRFIKPGITGLAQVSSLRGEIRTTQDIISRVEWDIHYLENWSLVGDVKIVAQTAWHVIAPPVTAY